MRSGPLWLDETLSVEIARLPLAALHDGLRQDGAPPLYYLLLKGWTAAVGTGTVAVRLLTVLLVPVALALAWLLGRRLGGVAGGRASVVALAVLPWFARYGSETRMYLLVVVLVLCGALALHAVHASGSRRSVAALAACVAALLLTHYWSLFLLAAVGLVYLPGLVRRRPGAVRVAVAGALGAAAFLPWLPTFLFQAAHTGAPWADPLKAVELLRTPRYWGGGPDGPRTVLAVLLVALAGVAMVRRPVLRLPGTVVLLTLVLAWASVLVGGGAYTGRYTAVVVPLVTLLVGFGAVALDGRWTGLVALGVLSAVALAQGVPAAGVARASARGVADALAASARPGDVLAYCPDQLGPPVARLLAQDGLALDEVVYPTLGAPQRVDWVDYEQRQDAADPAKVAARIADRAEGRQLFVLSATEYRTFEGDCEALLAALGDRRGAPRLLFGEAGSTGQLLFRFDR